MKTHEHPELDERTIPEIEEQQVEVPDDLSTLHELPPAHIERPKASTGVRWLRWLTPVVIVLAVVAAVALLVRSDGDETVVLPERTTAQQMIQESIDESLAARTQAVYELPSGQVVDASVEQLPMVATSYEMVQASIEHSLAQVRLGTRTTAQQMIQESIDEALAQVRFGTRTTAQQMIQESIDEALARLQG